VTPLGFSNPESKTLHAELWLLYLVRVKGHVPVSDDLKPAVLQGEINFRRVADIRQSVSLLNLGFDVQESRV